MNEETKKKLLPITFPLTVIFGSVLIILIWITFPLICLYWIIIKKSNLVIDFGFEDVVK